MKLMNYINKNGKINAQLSGQKKVKELGLERLEKAVDSSGVAIGASNAR